MTIVPFLGNNVFAPDDIQAMSEAFEEICKTLNLTDEAGSQRELIAKKVMAMAGGGERSANLLCERVLKDIQQGGVRGG